jgi:hypothetical protein
VVKLASTFVKDAGGLTISILSHLPST